MSISSWKEEFYTPVENVPKGDEVAALEQSLAKFKGLRPEAMAKHGVARVTIKSERFARIEDQEQDTFSVDGSTCSLCDQYYVRWADRPPAQDGCEKCPLYAELKGHSCDGLGLPFDLWYYEDNPEPMIEVLEKMLEDRK